MNKKTFLALALIIISLNCLAQTVGYSYKPLLSKGCSVRFSVAKKDSAYYLVSTIKSDRFKFLNEPVMMVRTYDGDVIKLNGSLIDNGSESIGYMSGNMVIPITKIVSTAQFDISPEQFELFKNGISKIRLSTSPDVHERKFKKDKIGKKLYKMFLKQRNKDDNF